jgi:hypothetical protein
VCLELPKQLNNTVEAAVDEVDFFFARQQEIRRKSRPEGHGKELTTDGSTESGFAFRGAWRRNACTRSWPAGSGHKDTPGCSEST